MKKLITAFICGIILSGTVVYAAVSARDISFKSTNENFKADNVEDAINELYNVNDKLDSYKNKYDKLMIQVNSESSSTVMSTGSLHLDGFRNKYKYFKVTSTRVEGTVSICKAAFWTYYADKSSSDKEVDIELNKEYSLQQINPQYRDIRSKLTSTGNTWARCVLNVELYN